MSTSRFPIDAGGERLIAAYLKSVDAFLESGRTPAAERDAVVDSLREQIYDSLIAAGNGELNSVIAVIDRMPHPNSFARAGGLPAAPSPPRSMPVAERYSPNPWAVLYMWLMQVLLTAVVLLLCGWRCTSMYEVYNQLGGEVPPTVRILAPPALFAWSYPPLAIVLLAIGHAPIYVAYFHLRKRAAVAVVIPIALTLGMLVYLFVMQFSIYLMLFEIPNMIGR